MINLKHAVISKLTLQFAGNKVREEKNIYAGDLFHLTEKEEEEMQPFLMSAFKNQSEFYQFTHYTQDVNFNVLYSLCKEVFEESIDFVEFSDKVLDHLFERSNHPQIKKGEIFVAFFNEIDVGQESKVSGIGIFKLENKNKFLRFRHTDIVECAIQKGYRLDSSIDKSCLILNVQKENGYRILVHDDAHVESEYWKKSFLEVDYIKDDSYQTKNYIHLLSDFSQQIIFEEKGKKAQTEFISNCLQVFNANETITEEVLEKELLEEYNVVEEFKNYKKEYAEVSGIQFSEIFDVSIPVLTREKRKIKTEIKLDTHIQIKLDINKPEASEDFLEQGYDEDKKMFYYKIYYNSEL
ncbi:MAG: nucleoid-associated protein [Flavobacteriaceae bacterium]|jgi:hypothetical protein|nr:nucleoid-associated protein [Flavobacteriaceae bacterium]